MLDLSMDLSGNFDFAKISADNLIKSSGVEFADVYDSLTEKLLD